MARPDPPSPVQGGFLGMGERGVGGSKCGSTAAVALVFRDANGRCDPSAQPCLVPPGLNTVGGLELPLNTGLHALRLLAPLPRRWWRAIPIIGHPVLCYSEHL